MTVFRPSLPPFSSTTTSTWSLRSPFAADSAARANRSGARPPSDSKDAPSAARPRNCRRLIIGVTPVEAPAAGGPGGSSIRVELRQAQDHAQKRPHLQPAEAGVVAELVGGRPGGGRD